MFNDRTPALNSGNSDAPDNIPAAISDIGCEREINEDRYAVIDSRAGRAWIVCDGMGGSLGGDLAAQLAIDAIRRGLESRAFANPTEAIQAAIFEANRIIVLRRQNPSFKDMGTTVVAAIIKGDEVALAHAGDSRAYLVRDGSIEQLTVDHTYVQDLVEQGRIDPEEALSHPDAHVLTRCVGHHARLELDVKNYWLWETSESQPEDKLVLMSDGLYSLVNDHEIADAVAKFSPQEACVQLVEMAKTRGGYDNITVAVLPLGGQLREESPSKRRSASPTVARETSRVRYPVDNISPGRRMVLMGLMAFLGMAMGCLIALMRVLQA